MPFGAPGAAGAAVSGAERSGAPPRSSIAAEGIPPPAERGARANARARESQRRRDPAEPAGAGPSLKQQKRDAERHIGPHVVIVDAVAAARRPPCADLSTDRV